MITSKDNEKLKLARRLAERRGREREGLFVTEGEDLLEAGLASGREPALALVAAGHRIEGIEVIEADPEALASASALGSGTRALAIWELPGRSEPPEGIEAPCVWLDRIADPGNVGAIIRSAAALWGARVALGPGCADPYGPKAVRASMGALFAHPPAAAGVDRTPAPRLGLAAHGGEPLDGALGAGAPATLCLGSEREGLGPEAEAACEWLATIPLKGAGGAGGAGVESLNVAASAAIALHRISSAAAQGSDSGNDR